MAQHTDLPTCHSPSLITAESKGRFWADLTEGWNLERAAFLQGSCTGTGRWRSSLACAAVGEQTLGVQMNTELRAFVEGSKTVL